MICRVPEKNLIQMKNKALLSQHYEQNKNTKSVQKDEIAIYAGFRTTKGYHPKKKEKPNQDRMLITSKFNNAENQWVF